ncbi:MAG: response regulator transcription factor [Chitinophagaceae bacterium]|nr:response regulator transcription factor [Chitinophagaceae bacterium]
MIKILMLEDEEPAAKRLQKLIKETEPDAEILAVLDSISKAKNWLQQNPSPDLMLVDIHLADGISLELFKQTEVQCPLIFTTAYDEYALQAFKLNSIDYLLKPVKKEELHNAVEKFKRQKAKEHPPVDVNKLLETMQQPVPQYRDRFVIRYGEHIKTIETKDASYFYTESRANFLVTAEGKRYVIDFNLDQLERMLNPRHFFRINRQFIVSLQAIDEMTAWTKARVLIKLKPANKQETIVSTERSPEFKKWLAGD